ncbi:MAG: phosphotriesterase-related protein [Chloroflexi bacterium]|nr:phosphotriesterase-related protein [Chloroflexota bacterium]
MPVSKFAGKAMTVLGPIEGQELGVTLPHEHLIMEHATANYNEPEDENDRVKAHQPVSLELLHWLSYHRSQNVDNLELLDEPEAIDEAMNFKKAGGGTIVDVTNIGIHRNPEALVRVSRATGLNIIMGSGHYLATSHPADMAARSEEEITEEIVRDVNTGVGESGIRAGIIGEIGCSWPLVDNEKKAMQAAARAQRLTGAPLNIHPGRRNNEAVLEILEILSNADADLSRTVISHIDIRVRDHKVRCQVAKAGCYLEYDCFGWSGPAPANLYKGTFISIPSDSGRAEEIRALIAEGYLDQILISHDVCHKYQRARYGGVGYDHISRYVMPLLVDAGLTEEQVNTITVENPKRMLCFI